MSDYSLVPVDHQPDFGSVSLVPVEHDPFGDDGVTQRAQTQQEQTQQAPTQPAQPVDQLQKPAAGVERLYVGLPANDTQASEPNTSTGPTLQPPARTPNVTPQQMLQGAINQYYPGAQFTGLARQAYQNGQYGNAIGYGVGAVADSLLALAGGKLLGPVIAAGANALSGISRSSGPLVRALLKAGQTRQAGYEAHHIVAKKASAADPARVKLRRLGIGIHDAANGVSLEVTKHKPLHNQQYHEAVDKALAEATSKAEGEQILQSIGERLKSGTFP